jgi:hypothetical protein
VTDADDCYFAWLRGKSWPALFLNEVGEEFLALVSGDDAVKDFSIIVKSVLHAMPPGENVVNQLGRAGRI